jgi:hypothetical protein
VGQLSLLLLLLLVVVLVLLRRGLHDLLLLRLLQQVPFLLLPIDLWQLQQALLLGHPLYDPLLLLLKPLGWHCLVLLQLQLQLPVAVVQQLVVPHLHCCQPQHWPAAEGPVQLGLPAAAGPRPSAVLAAERPQASHS